MLRVHAGAPLRGTARLPGDKSISHRVLLLSALANGPTVVRNLSPCGDVARTLAGLQGLGVQIDGAAPAESSVRDGLDLDPGTDAARGDTPPRPETPVVTVHGSGLRGLGGSAVAIDCGESGTTMRLLAGILSGQDRAFRLDGSAVLRRRPMDRVVDPLRSMGAAIEATPDGGAPIVGHGGQLTGRRIELQRASAQVGGAVLMAGLNAEGTTAVAFPAPVRDHTERMLAEMGAQVEWDGATSTIVGPVDRLHRWSHGDGEVPGDFSAASFVLAATALVQGSQVCIAHVGVNPGRTGLLDALDAMGAAPRVTELPTSGLEPQARLEMASADAIGADVGAPVASRAIDELPLVAVLATQASGRTTVRDAAELRVKECDRLAAIVDGLSRLGANIEEREDGFSVVGPTRLTGAAVDGHGDHRIVMALAVAGLVADGVTLVSDGDCVADSFPGFVTAMQELGADIAEIEG